MTFELVPANGGSVKRSSSIAALAAALAKAQGEIAGAVKDKTNPHFKSAYADLASVWDACRTPLSKNGLSVLQSTSADGPKVTVTTVLMHGSGEWMEGELTMTAQQNTPQGIGSCITYARRYALSAMVGVAPDDDDGNAASQANGNTKARQSRQAPPPLVVENTASLTMPPVGYQYVERIDVQAKGNFQWADVAFSTGEIALAKGSQLIALLEQIAQERVPVAVTTEKNKKGFNEIIEAVRWKPEQPAEPQPSELEPAPF